MYFSKLLTAFSICLSTSVLFAQHPSIGGYNVYFGHLHNHTGASDGKDTAFHAYPYARDSGKMDFFGLAEHDWLMRKGEWDTVKLAAEAFNQDNVFVAFAGFEWSNPDYGHVTVINTKDIAYYYRPESDNFRDLVVWLNKNNGYGFMNHPGDAEGGGNAFSRFTTVPSDRILGMELWGKKDGFERFYYNDGFYPNDGNKGFFDEALVRGWRIGATGSEDNHEGTWGKSNHRMAILANALTRTALLDAMKARRFYSTMDKNIAMSFKINGAEMGSEAMAGNDTIRILAKDGDNEKFIKLRLMCEGAVVDSVIYDTNYIDTTFYINTFCGKYYYAIVTQKDSNEAISSPVWIQDTSNNQSPVFIPVDTAIWFFQNDSATLTISVNDPDDSISRVEIFYDSMLVKTDTAAPYDLRIKLKSYGSFPLYVTAYDSRCGITAVLYDSIKVIKKKNILESNKEQIPEFYPNPCSSILHINTGGGEYAVSLIDMKGVCIYRKSFHSDGALEIDASSLENGLYLIILASEKNVWKHTFVKR